MVDAFIPRAVRGQLSRRDWIKLSGFGLAATSASGWLDVLAAEATRQPAARRKSCILLWLSGGPSHIDTFDPKPESPDAGEFKSIPTSVPGVHVSDQLPLLARRMDKLAIVRSMATGQGSHQRATFLMHTGHEQGQPFRFPSIGAIASRELGDPAAELPNFISVGGGIRAGQSSGYLGPDHAPFVVARADRGIENLRSRANDDDALSERVRLLDFLETRFRTSHHEAESIVDHQTSYRRALSLIQSPATGAFDLKAEDANTRERYGEDRFGQSCLVARRLVEAGVSFVEVPNGGWDTHRGNFDRLRKNLPIIDRAMSALLDDLEDRGLLDSTLVILMGEFGRTPKINKNAGRDHYARAWSTVLAGGGMPGGQVIGKTDELGATVVDRPVQATDFLATVCGILGIDYTRSYPSGLARRIRIVEEGEKPIDELLPTAFALAGKRRMRF